MVYIIPRSWTSGAYFKRFRKYFLTEGKLKHIHLFVSRNKVFDKEDVLQETIIIKVQKTNVNPTQVNSIEVNSMPVPDIESIQEMGRKLMKSKDLSERNCNLILEGYCG